MNSLTDFVKHRSTDRSVADVLAEIFRKQIIDGELLPGMRLIEAELVKLYGVSRSSVREAIRRLTAEGLVISEKHKSPTVRGVSKEQFMQMFDVRGVLEGFAARLAARNANDPLRRRWAQDEYDLWAAGLFASHDAFVAANTAFHAGILDMANHDVLHQQVAKLALPGYKMVFAPVVTDTDIALSSRQHAGILRAILDGDEELAERRMIAHVEDSSQRVTANYSDALFDFRLRELEKITD
jgi:DNA-binding GntR family transcriptional regulator